MTGPALYPFQQKFIADFDTEIANGKRRILGVAPTGSGKTVIAAHIVRRTADEGKHVLFLDHRIELTEQAAAKLYAAGIDAGIIQAGFAPRPGQHVQVASVQTLHARAVRSHSIDAPDADLVIVDEGHHAPAETYRRILELYPNAIVLGLTATPCRGDGRGLGSTFDSMIEAPQVAELIAGEFLSPYRMFCPTRPDLTGVRVSRGDYVEAELAERVNTARIVGDVIEHWHKHADQRPTVVFAVNVAHSAHLQDQFRRSGVLAEHLDAKTPADERKRVLKQFADRQIDVICNVGILGEGFDCPDIGALILARPTQSLGLYRQMVGRALRTAPGKIDAIILDHAGAAYAHGLPDDDILWTLSEDHKAANPRHLSRGKPHGLPAMEKCPECDGIRFEGQACPNCGWRPRPKARDIEAAEGDLGEVRRDRTVAASMLDKARFYGMLLWIAREKGRKPGSAFHAYQAKFGKDQYPDRFVEPIPPDDAVRAWVRHLDLKYAKSMQAKQRGAA